MNYDPYFFVRVLVTYFVSFENRFIPLSKNVNRKLNFSTIKCNLYIGGVKHKSYEYIPSLFILHCCINMIPSYVILCLLAITMVKEESSK
jgi:hypothetical protein